MIDHRPGDLVCAVSAEAGLADLNAELARRGQMLALDPPGAGRLTVGEVFDGALSGPRSHRYGDPRDLVLGVTVELADGTVARSGGRVVKNVAGYDLGRLFTGAHGRLGAIRELWLRLHPLPAATCTVVTDTIDPLPLEPLQPACVEYLWPPGRMLVRFESAVAPELARAARERIGGDLVEDDESLWAGHRELAAGLRELSCPPAAALETVDGLRERGATRIVGRLARGRLYADVEQAGRRLTPLEQRVIEAFHG